MHHEKVNVVTLKGQPGNQVKNLENIVKRKETKMESRE